MPGLEATVDVEPPLALNDVSLIRRPHSRVAELAYRLGGKEVGHVRCDGLVAATPAGSTGYNLANQGPILAWGVEGYVVSFIAPHTLTARPLVVAPDDVLSVTNARRPRPGRRSSSTASTSASSPAAPRWRSASATGSAASPSCPARTSTGGSATSSGAWLTSRLGRRWNASGGPCWRSAWRRSCC